MDKNVRFRIYIKNFEPIIQVLELHKAKNFSSKFQVPGPGTSGNQRSVEFKDKIERQNSHLLIYRIEQNAVIESRALSQGWLALH
jgi:hypothetical protein